jgi:hypothetical protein
MKYERQIQDLALRKVKTGAYKIFDENERIIGRERVDGISYLVLANKDGEVILIDESFDIVPGRTMERAR